MLMRRGKEDLMYAAIRQAKAKTGTAEELARRIKEGAIPIISDVEGFMAYYVVYAGDDTVTAISIFNKYEQAEEANRRALAWIAENVSSPIWARCLKENACAFKIGSKVLLASTGGIPRDY